MSTKTKILILHDDALEEALECVSYSLASDPDDVGNPHIQKETVEHATMLLEDWFQHDDTWLNTEDIDRVVLDLEDPEFYSIEAIFMLAVLNLIRKHPRLKSAFDQIYDMSIHSTSGDVLVHMRTQETEHGTDESV